MEKADLEKAALEMALKQARYTDVLTGIWNMEGLVRKAEEIFHINPQGKFAFIKLGINNFRFINRTCGFEVGDQVLQNVAKNLKAGCRPDEACGRLEKDIFAVIYEFHGKNEMSLRLKRLEDGLLDEDMKKKVGTEVCYTAGIYLPRDVLNENIKDMLDKALIAQQSISHKLNESRYVYYSDAMYERQYRETKIMEMAPSALQNEEFKLYIQPQIDLKTGRVSGGEALVRWIREDGMMIYPNDFIPLFESNDVILALDFYMLNTVCRKMKEWMDRGVPLVTISINQSGRHIENPGYLGNLCDVVDYYGIPHEYLALELTERTFVEHDEGTKRLANELYDRGFSLSIDDFGTGYSSLNLLSVVSADILKVDRSLIVNFDTNLKSRIILKKVIEMAQEIHMSVVCEGVETEQQYLYLKELGCDMGQGFYFSKAIPVSEFENMMENGRF